MFAVALLVSTLTALAAGRVYERCELARDLLALGVDREQVATWVCIAYHESRFDTAAQNYGSGDHGILQISELYWCGPGKACGAPCSAFRDNDISDDVRCALQIYKEHTRLQGDGFLAWVVYPHHCKHNAKKFIVDCDKNIYKSIPVTFEDRARAYKPYDIRSESKPRVANNPYRNPATPRYLSVNSVFQGDFVNEFEKNYYDNFKQSNWLNFKVDNIDDLKLPGVVTESQRPRFLELSTRPTPTTTVDPDLIGIKPPSPRRIETNQFRRRKTFSQPLFLRNRITADQKISQTTVAPVRRTTEADPSFIEDLSHNIFLNLQPSVISKSLKEFSSPQIKSTDLNFNLRRHRVKPPIAEESPTLTFEDLAKNPFLNSVFRPNFNTGVEPTLRVADFGPQSLRGYTVTTSRPAASFRSSKEIDFLRHPELNSNIPESSRLSSSQSNEDAEISIAQLAQNPFLSHIFHVNDDKSAAGASESYRQQYTLTTVKPTTEISMFKYPSTENYTSRRDHFKSTKTLTRGRARFLFDSDKTTTENPVTESSTIVTYSTRRYHTINRHRTSTTQNYFKSTNAIEPLTEKSTVLTTVKPVTNAPNRKSFETETTTSKTTTMMNTSLQNSTEINQINLTPQQSTSTTETTSVTPTTIIPETTTTFSYTHRAATNSNEPVSDSTSSPLTTRRQQTTNTVPASSRPQTPTNTVAVTTSHTTSRPQSTSRLQTTSWPQTVDRSDTSRIQFINKIENSTTLQTAGSTQTTRESQTASIPENTTRLPPSTRSWSYRRFREEARANSSTTQTYTYSRRRPTSLLASSTTFSNTTEKSLSTTTEASTGKTTVSIFDLYLKPSTRAPFKPFEFPSLNRLRKGISIFSGGTTKPPPGFYSYHKSTTEAFQGTDT